jgi:hypothetical protein
MRLLLVCLLLGALPATGKDQPAEAPVVLYEKLEQKAPESVMSAMRAQLAEVMEPLGFQFEWRSLNAARGSEVVAELAVITFRGRCDTMGLTSRSIIPPALGWTHISDGVILPFSEVDCDRVRDFVQKSLLVEAQAVRDELFGRALARVLAHELYHVFAQTTHHVSCGVAKAAYTVSDLLNPEFEFEKLETGLFKKVAARREITP